MKEEADLTLTVYNTLGQEVRTIYNGSIAGEETKRVSIDTQRLPSGVYFLRMKGDGVTATQRFTVVQ